MCQLGTQQHQCASWIAEEDANRDQRRPTCIRGWCSVFGFANLGTKTIIDSTISASVTEWPGSSPNIVVSDVSLQLVQNFEWKTEVKNIALQTLFALQTLLQTRGTHRSRMHRSMVQYPILTLPFALMPPASVSAASRSIPGRLKNTCRTSVPSLT